MVDVCVTMVTGDARQVRRVVRGSKRVAEQFERDLREALLRGTYREHEEEPEDKEVPRFAEWIDDFLDVNVRVQNKPAEHDRKRRVINSKLVPFFGKKRLDEITRHDVEQYRARRIKAGCGPKTVNNEVAVLQKALSVAVEWQLIESVPRVKPLKLDPQEFDFLSFEEAERLLAATDEPWRTTILVAMRTGLRAGELRALHWDDVDLVAGRLLVQRAWSGRYLGSTKTRKRREIPLSDDVIAALKAHRHLRGDWVFCWEDGRELNERSMLRHLHFACRRAGMRRIGWHVLRHTFASHLVMCGVPLKVVQELGGWKSLDMVLRYAHVSPNVHREAVKLLDRGSNSNMAATAAGGA